MSFNEHQIFRDALRPVVARHRKRESALLRRHYVARRAKEFDLENLYAVREMVVAKKAEADRVKAKKKNDNDAPSNRSEIAAGLLRELGIKEKDIQGLLKLAQEEGKLEKLMSDTSKKLTQQRIAAQKKRSADRLLKVASKESPEKRASDIKNIWREIVSKKPLAKGENRIEALRTRVTAADSNTYEGALGFLSLMRYKFSKRYAQDKETLARLDELDAERQAELDHFIELQKAEIDQLEAQHAAEQDRIVDEKSEYLQGVSEKLDSAVRPDFAMAEIKVLTEHMKVEGFNENRMNAIFDVITNGLVCDVENDEMPVFCPVMLPYKNQHGQMNRRTISAVNHLTDGEKDFVIRTLLSTTVEGDEAAELTQLRKDIQDNLAGLSERDLKEALASEQELASDFHKKQALLKDAWADLAPNAAATADDTAEASSKNDFGQGRSRDLTMKCVTAKICRDETYAKKLIDDERQRTGIDSAVPRHDLEEAQRVIGSNPAFSNYSKGDLALLARGLARCVGESMRLIKNLAQHRRRESQERINSALGKGQARPGPRGMGLIPQSGPDSGKSRGRDPGFEM